MNEPSAGESPMMVPAHGNGLLKRGGNHPRPGRPSDAIRRRLRGSLAERIPTLREIADNKDEDTKDRLKAIDLMGKYGLGSVKELSVEHVRERLSSTLDIIRKHLSPEQAEALISELEPVWR